MNPPSCAGAAPTKLEQLGRAVVAAPDVQSRLRRMVAEPLGLKKRLVIDTVPRNHVLAQAGNLN